MKGASSIAAAGVAEHGDFSEGMANLCEVTLHRFT
jgi:hypothetical protein